LAEDIEQFRELELIKVPNVTYAEYNSDRAYSIKWRVYHE
jgi:hypothetical protein